MDTVKVLILKSSSPTFWYAKKIGQIFECYSRTNTYQVMDSMYGVVQFIDKGDAQIVDTLMNPRPIKKLFFIP